MSLTADIDPAPRAVKLTYTNPAGAAKVTVTRKGPSGEVFVRGWIAKPVSVGTDVVIRDYEAPIGIELNYVVEGLDAGFVVIDTATATTTIPSDGCGDTWLNDLAQAQNTIQIVMEAMEALDYEVPATVHEVIDRRTPIVSSDVAKTPGFELSFLTDTLDRRDRARSVLGNGVPVLLRTPPANGIGNLYLSVLGFSEQRIVTLATNPARRFVVTGRQVDRPPASLYQPSPPTTYADVAAEFATLGDVNAGRESYDAVLYSWTAEAPGDIVPWPPDDL